MKEKWIKIILNRIKEVMATDAELNKIGVNIEYHHGLINLLEESIAALVAENEANFERVLELIAWWLYEAVEKTVKDKNGEHDLTKAEDFAKFLIKEYS